MDLTMSWSSLSLLFFISVHIHFLVPASCEFRPFLDYDPFVCGDQQLSYPFKHVTQPSYYGYPGYELDCDGDNFTLSMESLEYRVIHIDRSAKILKVERSDLSDDICLPKYVDTALNFSLFDYASQYFNFTLFYGCNSSSTPQLYDRFPCPLSRDGYFAFDPFCETVLHKLCNFIVLVPISLSEAPGLPTPPPEGGDHGTTVIGATISELLNKGFEITWIADTTQCDNCTESGGICGYNWERKRFNCFCLNGAYSPTCNGKRVSGSFPASMYAYSHLLCGF
ncbi:LEAF RUST 10 DISEASE-RESISTANCE LOCUS RECEPTOR-LIKE PROTEIN KINASE-like 2.7 [Syzygium oleosum]|uniref:LEAF RUST 10 DISEASE-RESISTANCE LOCUS RECEPTOR-LIKE PROTEIN KINASE-like 2.7 n=1 Tax=Syzygium oleosum TaxID=219896 RepID=UPI0011D1E0E8|nr:LEAF RUST 10 DISEASE-RESISTANCE LOCUS RECEPTOR-LIKE PROTEIN KINASE-like 2.7 [Syzygium oleosum]